MVRQKVKEKELADMRAAHKAKKTATAATEGKAATQGTLHAAAVSEQEEHPEGSYALVGGTSVGKGSAIAEMAVLDRVASEEVISATNATIGPNTEESALTVNQEYETIKENAGKVKLNANTVNSLYTAAGFRKNVNLKSYLETPPHPGRYNYVSWHIAHFMDASYTKGVLVLAIVINAVLIGLQADYPEWTDWESIERFFLFLFTVELILNLIGFGRMYWEDAWNWMDASIIAVCLADFVVTVALDNDSNSALTVIRLVRILRVIRVITFLDTMVYLVSAFLKAMQTIVWVLVLWLLAIYIFAVMAKTFFGDDEYLKKELEGKVDVDRYFGSIPACMITLFSFYTYDSSLVTQRYIGEVYPAAWIFFAVFIIVVSIGMMELMTSLFIDALLEEKARVEKKNIVERERRRAEVQQLITGLFSAFDEDKSSTLDKEEMESCMAVFEDDTMKDLLDYVQIDPKMMQEAISVADIDGDNSVSAEEFQLALESIHLPPMKSDIRQLHQRVGCLQRLVERNNESLNVRFDHMENRMEAILQVCMRSVQGVKEPGLR